MLYTVYIILWYFLQWLFQMPKTIPIYSVVIFLQSALSCATFPSFVPCGIAQKYQITNQKIKYMLPNCVDTQRTKLVDTAWSCSCQNIGKLWSVTVIACFRRINFLAAMRDAVFTDSRIFDWLIFLERQLIK